jgi:hypothetical protein
MVMPSGDVYVRSDAVVARMIDGETLAIPVRGGIGDLASIYRFNEVGTMIWEALAKPMTFEELVDLIERDYEATWKSVCGDVDLFLTEMRSAGLVTTANARAMSDDATPKTDRNEKVRAASFLLNPHL